MKMNDTSATDKAFYDLAEPDRPAVESGQGQEVVITAQDKGTQYEYYAEALALTHDSSEKKRESNIITSEACSGIRGFIVGTSNSEEPVDNLIVHAADVLASAGVPVTRVTSNGEMTELQMEHVWVRAFLPYTDYRGAGNAGGEKVWIDLDTSIKPYEDVANIYDIAADMDLPEGLAEAVEQGEEETIEAILEEYAAEVEDMDLEGVYNRKRVIRQEELSYLPASLQYEVKKELATFAEISNTDKDSIRFEAGGEVLGTYTASELAGRNILLAFLPASTEDAEILGAYDSIFDVPASYVYVKPVLLADNQLVSAAGDVAVTLGTAQTFTITLNRAGNVADKTKTIRNTVTAGSMYAVTIDSQTITGAELQSSYDQVAALTESVTEANVYSPDYLGRYLSLAGRLYFAEVDLYNIHSGEIYGVSNTRKLSTGITGYEVQKISRYGVVTSLSAGNLYIDVDADDHAVVSLTGDEQTVKAYMISSGIMSSLYEGIVWEQLTGREGVSTISIFQKAKEEGMELLQITKDNLETELEKLNTDEATRQAVVDAVNSGNMVTIPTDEVTIGEWSGTGYIIMDENGSGAYMISGGLNGGADPVVLTIAVIVATIVAVVAIAALVTVLDAILIPALVIAIAAAIIILNMVLIFQMYEALYEYIDTGDPEAQAVTEEKMMQLIILAFLEQLVAEFIYAFLIVPGLAEPLKKFLQSLFKGKGKGGSTSPKGLIGHDFEDYLTQNIGGDGSFRVDGREFDGGIGNRWWEAKSGQYWDMLETNPNKLAKFKSDMGDHLRIATENGATYELFSNTPIPSSIKQWLDEKGISYTELLD